MSPTTEEQPVRTYCMQLKDGTVARVRAATICRPTNDDPIYRLKREGQIVGEFLYAHIAGWWIEQEKPAGPVVGQMAR